MFINRLTSPTLQAAAARDRSDDPLRLHGAGAEVGAACQAVANKPSCDRLHRAQLDDKDNPYNTYQHEGLPPGPIRNPGKGSIEAMLAPDGTDYFYFVAKDARNHAFARTEAEHERNVEKCPLIGCGHRSIS